jgi:hypothetical protein
MDVWMDTLSRLPSFLPSSPFPPRSISALKPGESAQSSASARITVRDGCHLCHVCRRGFLAAAALSAIVVVVVVMVMVSMLCLIDPTVLYDIHARTRWTGYIECES